MWRAGKACFGLTRQHNLPCDSLRSSQVERLLKEHSELNDRAKMEVKSAQAKGNASAKKADVGTLSISVVVNSGALQRQVYDTLKDASLPDSVHPIFKRALFHAIAPGKSSDYTPSSNKLVLKLYENVKKSIQGKHKVRACESRSDELGYFISLRF